MAAADVSAGYRKLSLIEPRERREQQDDDFFVIMIASGRLFRLKVANGISRACPGLAAIVHSTRVVFRLLLRTWLVL